MRYGHVPLGYLRRRERTINPAPARIARALPAIPGLISGAVGTASAKLASPQTSIVNNTNLIKVSSYLASSRLFTNVSNSGPAQTSPLVTVVYTTPPARDPFY